MCKHIMYYILYISVIGSGLPSPVCGLRPSGPHCKGLFVRALKGPRTIFKHRNHHHLVVIKLYDQTQAIILQQEAPIASPTKG